MAFADASMLLASEPAGDAVAYVIDAAIIVDPNIDPFITGPVTPVAAKSKGILRLIDGCDAECQAVRLGLVFSD